LGAWRLRDTAGIAQGRIYPLAGEVRIGRDTGQCAVHLADPNVSRQHAVLTEDATAGGWRIRRLSTTNPLHVNGRAVEEALVRAGDQIQIASSVLVLESP
jgi:pSer/pThr/pTyr-binding forkhead associated (FHA) protein